MSRLFSNETMPQYAWDGQVSSITLDAPVDSAYSRSVDVLRAMNFILDKTETRRQAATGRVAGAKANHTVVLILLEEKTPGKTLCRVRVGTVGDRTGSERILDEIQKSLRKKS